MRFVYVLLLFTCGFAVSLLVTNNAWAALQEDRSAEQSSAADKPAESTERPARSGDNKEEENASNAAKKGQPVDLDALNAYARKNTARKFSRLASEIVDLFPPVIGSVSPSTLRLYSGRNQVAIGTVIDPQGLVLTVASELGKDMTARLPDGSSKPTQVLGIDKDTGLALLKVEAEGLTPANLSLVPVPEVGSWIASVSPDRNPVAVGVVSVKERKITGSLAFIGIQSRQDSSSGRGVLIDVVTYESPAYKADIRVGDRIIQVGDKEVNSMLEIQQVLRDYAPGDNLDIVVLRGSKEISLTVILAPRDQFDQTINSQDRMGSTLSKRRQGFQLAFQHDSFLQAYDCGSPLVDLDGRVVGINIARAGRVSSLALPLSVVLPAIEKLKSGELAPAVINAKRIEQLTRELESLKTEVGPLAEQADQEQQALQKHRDKIEALKSVYDDLVEKLKALESEKERKEEQIDSLRKRMAEIELRQKRIQEEIDSLRSGALK